jgi:DNA-binding protein HU-beta
LIKLDIINEVVNKTGITKTKAEMAVETVFEKMKRALEQGDRIELRGFGVFTVKPRKTGIGRNPRTGAEVSIPPGKAVRFKPGKELADAAIAVARKARKYCVPRRTIESAATLPESRARVSDFRGSSRRLRITPPKRGFGCTCCCCWRRCSPPRWWARTCSTTSATTCRSSISNGLRMFHGGLQSPRCSSRVCRFR